ncbi:hypothetical protein ACHAXS_000198, partial [Conticribra weissflogii]
CREHTRNRFRTRRQKKSLSSKRKSYLTIFHTHRKNDEKRNFILEFYTRKENRSISLT